MAQENRIKTVVIDAGHGGKDPGALGALTNEKTITLGIALKLGEYIKAKYPEIKVIYTRDKDVFIELDNRAKVANMNNADLFISIHANSAAPAAYGSETYVLGLHRTKSQEDVAKRENSIIHYEENAEEKYADFDMSPDAIIARQFQLSVYLNQSISIASRVQQHFKEIGRHDRGVKQAGFLVLYKTTMPSMLIEVGFISNPAEEKFMHSEEGKIKLANSIFKAFQEYKAEVEGVNILVEDGKGYKAELEAISNKGQDNKTEDKKPKPEETPKPVNTPKPDDKKPVETPKPTNNNTETTPVSTEKDAVIFKVQIVSSSKTLPSNSAQFKGESVEEYFDNGLYKYTAGSFKNDFDAANVYKNKMREKGFTDAFVVSFVNGKRIPIQEGIEKAKGKK